MPNTPTELAALAAITPAALLLGWWLAHRSGQADQRRAQAELAPRLAKLDRNLAALKAEAEQVERAAYRLRLRDHRLERQLADTGRAIAKRKGGLRK